MPKFRRIGRRLLQATVIFVITFGLAEIAFRVYHHFQPSFVFYDGSYNRFRGKPFAPNYDFHLNSRGFNDLEFNQTKSVGTFRVLGIGDSIAFGIVPYQHNYLTLLEEKLNQGGKHVEVLNMGILGTSPEDYLSLLVNEGLDLKPDAVLVTFFIGNDFQDKKSARRWYTYSYVASFVNYLFDVRRKYRRGVVEPPTSALYYDNHPSVSDEAYLVLEKTRSEIHKNNNDDFIREHEKATRYVIEMKRICDERNIQFLIAIAPDEIQVNRQLQARVVESFAASANDFDFSLPNRLLGAKLKENKIDYVDLLDDFLPASTQKTLYKPNDSHWNIEGNRLAMEIIERHLFRKSSVQDPDAPITQPRSSRKRS